MTTASITRERPGVQTCSPGRSDPDGPCTFARLHFDGYHHGASDEQCDGTTLGADRISEQRSGALFSREPLRLTNASVKWNIHESTDAGDQKTLRAGSEQPLTLTCGVAASTPPHCHSPGRSCGGCTHMRVRCDAHARGGRACANDFVVCHSDPFSLSDCKSRTDPRARPRFSQIS